MKCNTQTGGEGKHMGNESQNLFEIFCKLNNHRLKPVG